MPFIRILIMCLLCLSVNGQPLEIYKRQFRFTIEDDYLNIRGEGTDKAYTGGLQMDYFYNPRKKKFLSGLWLPKAGRDADNVTGIGISYIMYTPSDLSLTTPTEGDYPYAGAIVVKHSLFSFNPLKRYNLQSTFSLGVMGPIAFAKEIQSSVHQLIGDEKPMGWNNQLPNDILLNFKIAGEVKLLEVKKWFEIIGGAKFDLGTQLDDAGIYCVIRAGKMLPYFLGFLAGQGMPRSMVTGRKRFQAYFTIKPMATFVAHNSLLEGGLILNRHAVISPPVNRFVASVDYGPLVSWRNFTVSYTQSMTTSQIQGLGMHETGKIALYFSW